MTHSNIVVSFDLAHRPGDDPVTGNEFQPTSPGAVVAELSDANSRAIMSAVAEEFRPVTELAAACEMPLSTAYRKVNTLVETGLLAERNGIPATGTHATEYRLRPTSLAVTLTPSGDLEVTASPETHRASAAASRPRGDAERPNTIEVDSGQESFASHADRESYPAPSLFVDVPGTERRGGALRAADSSRENDNQYAGLPTSLLSVVTDDTPADTIDEPERGGTE